MSIVSLKIGTLITVREVTQVMNDYGDATETLTDHAAILGVVQILDGSETTVKEGQLRVGDADAFFDYDAATVGYYIPGNRILYQNVWYEIKNVIKEQVGETIVFIELLCSRCDQ